MAVAYDTLELGGPDHPVDPLLRRERCCEERECAGLRCEIRYMLAGRTEPVEPELRALVDAAPTSCLRRVLQALAAGWSGLELCADLGIPRSRCRCPLATPSR
jgi:hypothetical protein